MYTLIETLYDITITNVMTRNDTCARGMCNCSEQLYSLRALRSDLSTGTNGKGA